MKKLFAVSIVMTLFSTGCASIVDGTNQSVSVETAKDGVQVSEANCTLKNDKGVWYVTTPGSTVVHRSYDDLNVSCEKLNLDPGMITVKSSTKGMTFGNILLGGFIGAGIDAASGAAYDYPNVLSVEMGKTSSYLDSAPKPEMTAAANTSVASTATATEATK